MAERGQGRGAGLGSLRGAMGLARLGAESAMRASLWTAERSARAAGELARAAATGQPPTDLVRGGTEQAREAARRFLGIAESVELGRTGDELKRAAAAAAGRNGDRNGRPPSLRERGAELLRRSADVNFEEDTHPAYTRILEQLAPDEGRILRLFALEGPQPSVDVRAGLLPLNATSELIAPGLNMIGEEAGARHLDDVPAYLNNLFRLGLIWFSREPLPDPLRYQVLEAQPVVTQALGRAPRTRTVRRSVELTPFGRDFCHRCLPLETAELEALDSQPAAPPEADPSGGDPGQPDA